MKTRDLVRIGIPALCSGVAKQVLQRAQSARRDMRTVMADLARVAEDPASFRDHASTARWPAC